MDKSGLDLRVLENADNATLERLSAGYKAMGDSDRDRLFERSLELYSERTEGNNDKDREETVVSGVEEYRRSRWHKLLAAASVVLIAAGVGAGTAALLKNMKGRPDADLNDSSSTEMSSVSAAVNVPFGDISEARVRFTSAAYVPYLYEADADEVRSLAEAFNRSQWEEADADAPPPDGESALVYVNSGGQTFTLVFYGDNTVDWENGGAVKRYRVSEEASAAAYSAANPEELQGRLIWSKIEDLNADGVWKNNEPVPERIFEDPEVPEAMKNKKIIEYEPLYEYAFDFRNFESVLAHSDNIITGRVDNIYDYPVSAVGQGLGVSGTAYTVFEITVTGDVSGVVSAGDKVGIITIGGYISMRDFSGDTLDMRGGKYGDGSNLTDEEIYNTYYHIKTEYSQGQPIVGREYAFCVYGKSVKGFELVGESGGVLYKCDNIYIRQGDNGFSFYEPDELTEHLGTELPSGHTAGENDNMTADVPVATEPTTAPALW